MTITRTGAGGAKQERTTSRSPKKGNPAHRAISADVAPHDAPHPRQRNAAVCAVADAPGPIQPPVRHLLRLYIAGVTSHSVTAVANLKSICEEYLKGQYQLDVVDIYQQPALASRAQITAVPTLIRRLPLPLRRIVGDMSRKERVLIGLDILEQV